MIQRVFFISVDYQKIIIYQGFVVPWYQIIDVLPFILYLGHRLNEISWRTQIIDATVNGGCA